MPGMDKDTELTASQKQAIAEGAVQAAQDSSTVRP